MEGRRSTAVALLFAAASIQSLPAFAQNPGVDPAGFTAISAEYQARGLVFTFGGELFRPGGTRLAPASAPAVLELAQWLGRHPERHVRLEGHTDSRGDADYNKLLSRRRAEGLKRALTWRGIAPARMTAVGFGESRPVASNDTVEGRRTNRRVEVVVLGR